MKKNTKKTASKTASKPRAAKATKNLDVKPAKGESVRGGIHGGWDMVGNKKY